MPSTFAYNLAKNGVNGLPSVRRAATASQVGGRFSSPNSPMNTGTACSWGNDDTYCEVVITSPTSLAASIAARPRIISSFSDLSNNQSFAASNGLATVITKMSMASESDDEFHPGRRGSLVDKTNPFIGYFQTGTEEDNAEVTMSKPAEATILASPMPSPPPTPMHRVPLRTQSSATLSSMSSFHPSTFLTPQKTKREWIGSQTSRFPTFFKHRDAKEVTCQQQSQLKQRKRAAFLDILKWKSPALVQVSTDESHEVLIHQKRASFKRTASLPSAISSKATPIIPPPLISATSETKTTATVSNLMGDTTCAFNYRFEQDFEIVGSLGEGGQGSVFKVRSKVDGCFYAIKKVVLPRATELDANRAEHQALREVRLMASMAPHPNVVRYHTAWTEVDTCASDKTLSVESVRGSDVPFSESDCSPEGLQRQQLALLDEEAELRMSNLETTDPSFLSDFSSDSLKFDEYSTLGLTFEDVSEDEDSVGLCNDDEAAFGRPGELKNEVCMGFRSRSSQPAVMKAQVILYIQMELCGTAVNAKPITATTTNHEPLYHILDQLESPLLDRQQLGQKSHSTLGAWLRSSFEERSAWANTSDIHQKGLKLFLSAAQGVTHMHSHGVIHRDLKPDNIFIHGDEAKIGDFGLSKSVYLDGSSDEVVSPREHLQELGLSDGNHTTALGTFTYASPEQLGYRFGNNNVLKNAANRLKSAKYSIKSDIYALGVILLELCCPFGTMMERSQVLTGVRHGVVPQKARQSFAMEMDLVLRMTSIDPSDRPTSEEVCAQLRKILARSKSAITPASALEELRELQAKLAAAIRQVRDRSKATLQLEALIVELNDKVQNVGLSIA